jgi:hypothetical protein
VKEREMKHRKEKEKLSREWKEQKERNTMGTVYCFLGHPTHLAQYLLSLKRRYSLPMW